MPWSGPQFEKFNHSLTPEQSLHAATVANAILKQGVGEGHAIAIANHLAGIPHRDDGGAVFNGGVTPNAQNSSPGAASYYSRFAQMDPIQLHQTIAKLGNSPLAAIAQRVLTQKQAQPAAQESAPAVSQQTGTNGMATAATGGRIHLVPPQHMMPQHFAGGGTTGAAPAASSSITSPTPSWMPSASDAATGNLGAAGEPMSQQVQAIMAKSGGGSGAPPTSTAQGTPSQMTAINGSPTSPAPAQAGASASQGNGGLMAPSGMYGPNGWFAKNPPTQTFSGSPGVPMASPNGFSINPVTGQPWSPQDLPGATPLPGQVAAFASGGRLPHFAGGGTATFAGPVAAQGAPAPSTGPSASGTYDDFASYAAANQVAVPPPTPVGKLSATGTFGDVDQQIIANELAGQNTPATPTAPAPTAPVAAPTPPVVSPAAAGKEAAAAAYATPGGGINASTGLGVSNTGNINLDNYLNSTEQGTLFGADQHSGGTGATTPAVAAAPPPAPAAPATTANPNATADGGLTFEQQQQIAANQALANLQQSQNSMTMQGGAEGDSGGNGGPNQRGGAIGHNSGGMVGYARGGVPPTALSHPDFGAVGLGHESIGKFARGGMAGHDHPTHVPIMAAGGEFVIHPHHVARLGGGDIKEGHRLLDQFVVGKRHEIIKKMQKLKPPVKN